MQYSMMFLILSASLLLSGCSKMSAEAIEYLPTQSETVTTVFPNQDSYPTKFSIEIFPKEIYFGDTIYLVFYHENISPEAVKINFSDGCYYYEYDPKKYTLSSTIIPEKYHWKQEDSSNAMDWRPALRQKKLQPGEKYPDQKNCLEFPPLEDWNVPFWKELREKIPQEGITCKLHIKHGYYDHDLQEPRSMEIDQNILIKPRPVSEMTLLNKWYKNTPKKLFPQDDGDRKVPNLEDYDLKSSGLSDIKIGWDKYDPWLFIRIGNRKPSDPNNPTTLDGWRKLESSLTPSTMRDEVRLTRLQLEYYCAKKGEASDNAKQELVKWLKSLPEPQQTIMPMVLVYKMIYDFSSKLPTNSPLRVKSRELIRALYDMLDHGCKEAVCQEMYDMYQDRSLTPPEDVVICRSITEVLTPTAEDLAHGSKDLPDGFRIWDYSYKTRPQRIVAQFVELVESENAVRLKDRMEMNCQVDFSALSDEDQQYAREQSELVKEAGR